MSKRPEVGAKSGSLWQEKRGLLMHEVKRKETHTIFKAGTFFNCVSCSCVFFRDAEEDMPVCDSCYEDFCRERQQDAWGW